MFYHLFPSILTLIHSIYYTIFFRPEAIGPAGKVEDLRGGGGSDPIIASGGTATTTNCHPQRITRSYGSTLGKRSDEMKCNDLL